MMKQTAITNALWKQLREQESAHKQAMAEIGRRNQKLIEEA